jgi:hypothetical protein
MAGNIENQAGHSVPVGTSAIMVHGGQLAATTAGVLPVGGDFTFPATDNSGYSYPAPRQGTIRNGKVKIIQNLTGGSTVRVAIQINGAGILTLDVTRNGATGVQDIPGTTSAASEDAISIRVDDTINVGGVGTFQAIVTYEYV